MKEIYFEMIETIDNSSVTWVAKVPDGISKSEIDLVFNKAREVAGNRTDVFLEEIRKSGWNVTRLRIDYEYFYDPIKEAKEVEQSKSLA